MIIQKVPHYVDSVLTQKVASAALRSSPHELRKYGKQFARMAKEEAARKRG